MGLSLRALLPALAAQGLELPAEAVPVAVGWATVDLERAIRELAGETRVDPTTVRSAPDDEALGAVAKRLDLADGALLFLEPRTEGGLAAALARHGEGPVAVYLSTPRSLADATAGGLAAATLLAPLGDPLGGLSRLVRPARAWGPFVLYHGRRSE
jgi:hypothetical protein